MSELKPCPFCGGRMMPRHALWPSEGDTDAIIHTEPTDCPIEGVFSIGTADEGVSVAEAWNRRAALEGDAQPVAVKALEWWKSDTGDIIADSIVGRYRLGKVTANANFRLETPSGVIDRPTLDYWPEREAKAAAQADFEQRIRSALVATSSDSLRKLEVAREALHNVLPTLEELAEKRGLSFSEAGGLADDVRAALSQLEKPGE